METLLGKPYSRYSELQYLHFDATTAQEDDHGTEGKSKTDLVMDQCY